MHELQSVAIEVGDVGGVNRFVGVAHDVEVQARLTGLAPYP